MAPYLTLFARAGISREAADSAVAKLEIHELPSARGCTYVVPASDFAFALAAGESFAGDMKTAYKLGVTDKEIEKLCDAVVKALAKVHWIRMRFARPPATHHGVWAKKARKKG